LQSHCGSTRQLDTGKNFLQALSKLLSHVKKQVQQGLASDAITMSYSGLLEEINQEPVLQEFRSFCAQHQIKTLLTMMSLCSAINIGPKSFALSFATTKTIITTP
jgi:fatty acid-binding protein DegV